LAAGGVKAIAPSVDVESMCRVLSISILLLLVAGLVGCGALEELDKANAMVGNNVENKKQSSDTAAATGAAPRTNPLLEQSKQWWEGATSLAPKAMDSSIVSCRIDGGTQFMAKDDCLTRGGRPGSTSS